MPAIIDALMLLLPRYAADASSVIDAAPLR